MSSHPSISIIQPEFEGSGSQKKFVGVKNLDGMADVTTQEMLSGDYERSEWMPTPEEKEVRDWLLKCFYIGTLNQWTPRVEFNDLSLIERDQYDQQLWNTYQPNNGAAPIYDNIQGWRSNAMRPIVRNKAISILAHTMAELVFPRVNAYNNQSDSQADAAQAMEDIQEWAADKSNYAMYELRRGMAALSTPASIGYTEYAETYRRVKRVKEDGSWEWDTMLDPIYSGFQNMPVPVDELLIENFYENDIQKQGFLIWRKVIPYSQAKAKYSSLYPSFDLYVKPGAQVIYNDANQSFYNVYDPNLRQYDVEEVTIWSKDLDVKLIFTNGVLLTPHDNPNPRLDKLYPFDKFGWQLINNRCFYYKSLSFSLQQDANILNTLYPMIVDGTYLNLFPPTFNNGGEVIGSDVMVPGANVTLSGPNSVLQPIKPPSPLADGMNTLAKIESSLSESSQDTLQSGQQQPGQDMTAYQLSLMQQNSATILGLFRQMRAQHVKDFGELRLGDIVQYLTIPDVNDIIGDSKLVYKTFVLHNKQSGGSSKTRKIKFNPDLPDTMSSDEHMKHSLRLLQEGGGVSSKHEIYEVNPSIFRALKFELSITPDRMNPKSDELLRAFKIDLFDKMISSPPGMFDPEETARLLLSSDSDTRKDPEKYLAKSLNAPPLPGVQQPQQGQQGGLPQLPQGQQPQQAPSVGGQLSPTQTPQAPRM